MSNPARHQALDRPLRLGLAQLNLTVGDIAGNLHAILAMVDRARTFGVDVLAFPEMAVCGYPPEDLLLRDDFLDDAWLATRKIASAIGDMVVFVGFPHRVEFGLFNAVAICTDGHVAGTYHKAHLPNYGVFDERRYFTAPPPSDAARLVRAGGHPIGVTICEDIWHPGPPLTDETLAGAELIVNVSASPYRHGVVAQREQMLATRCRDNICAVAYCNLVGGQDELVFDGGSLVLDHDGSVIARAAQYREELLIADLDLTRTHATRRRTAHHRADTSVRAPVVAEVELPRTRPAAVTPPAATVAPPLEEWAEVYGALVLGLRDYATKSGFTHAVLGLSGGIDSALVALVAVDALGADRVTCVVMPSRFSSTETQSDARALAHNLGVDCREVRIDTVMDAYAAALATEMSGMAPDITEENLQARIRGNLLMALSNKYGWLLLSTGNKSEMSVGYATLYGDMAGGLAVIKDVPKQMVYALMRWRSRGGEVVPVSIIERPPTAELRVGQRDTDSLPPYEILDPILRRYVEEDDSPEAIARSADPDVVHRVTTLVDRAEYKRRQAPPGIKVTTRAFGRDRRMPVVNCYRRDVAGDASERSVAEGEPTSAPPPSPPAAPSVA